MCSRSVMTMTGIDLPKGFKPNTGRMPRSAAGKRVAVILANGKRPDPDFNGSGYPRGWAADGKGACNWTLTGHPFDIVGWMVLG